MADADEAVGDDIRIGVKQGEQRCAERIDQ